MVSPRAQACRGHERPEFARNHSGSIEMQRNSREATAGASKRNGICAKPQRGRRNQGPVPPPRAPLRSATNFFTLNVRTPLCKHCLGKNENKNENPYITHVRKNISVYWGLSKQFVVSHGLLHDSQPFHAPETLHPSLEAPEPKP